MSRHNRAGWDEFLRAVREVPLYDIAYSAHRLTILLDDLEAQQARRRR